MTESTLTPSRLWRRMTADQRLRAARAFWSEEQAADDHIQAILLIAQQKKFRPKFVAGLDVDRRERRVHDLGAIEHGQRHVLGVEQRRGERGRGTEQLDEPFVRCARRHAEVRRCGRRATRGRRISPRSSPPEAAGDGGGVAVEGAAAGVPMYLPTVFGTSQVARVRSGLFCFQCWPPSTVSQRTLVE